MKLIIGVLYLLVGITFAEDCSDKETGDTFSDDGCVSYYYVCNHDSAIQMACGDKLAYNPGKGECDWPYNIPACSPSELVDCHDAAGNPATSGGYTKPGDCNAGIYYECQNGVEIEKDCGTNMIYDPEKQVCDWSANIPDCDVTTTKSTVSGSTTTTTPASLVDKTTTTPGAGDPSDYCAEDEYSHGGPFVPDGGVCVHCYYRCVGDKALKECCSGDLVFDPELNTCNWEASVAECHLSPEEPTPSESTTTTTSTSTGTKPSPDSGTASSTTTTSGTSTTTTPSDIDTTSTTVQKPAGDTFVGFVVDDTGSMANEIVAVKEWIQGCVDGSSSSCGTAPTGGWVITSFNDPYVGRVVGPTLDTTTILNEAENYYAHGGGDCPEMAFTGLRNAVNVIPEGHGGCKMYLFTDATAADAHMHEDVTALYETKGCSLILILTGCCGTCPDACESTSPEYCTDHVTDSRSSSTRVARSTSDDIQSLFYIMSEATGGNTYVTDKPSSPEDMLEFLEDEVTLGFCSRADIAGPLPNGYGCEEDCTYMGMCWDKSVSQCHCEPDRPCTNDPMSKGTSRCGGAQIVECDEDIELEIIPDLADCNGYFQCNSGTRYHFNCANGTIYSSDSTSYCDHPENVDPPCGTKSPEDIE